MRPDTLNKALQRLEKSKRIRQIRRGFYVIIPLEYSSRGMIPADWFIDSLMKFVGKHYYVGVLSAAALHGAAHQQPQEYQVVVGSAIRPVESDIIRIHFFRHKAVRKVAVQQMKTYTGYMLVSTPACTALDLLRFNTKIGGLDAVLTALVELVEKISSVDLLGAARREPERSQVQRLGWMLDQIERRDLSDPLARWVAKKRPTKVALDVSRSKQGFRKDPRWQVIVNAEIEAEL
jgi:predicted transcriptional regulator of viral defense system